MAVITVTFRTPAAAAAQAIGPHGRGSKAWTPRARAPEVRPALFERGWARLQEALVLRRTRRLLAQMDDRMLSDIGVSRADAGSEAQRPLWHSDLLR